ncbi:MAG: hypothetical protein CMJ94_08025 [Planctomycetes bacterium]|nr:hypothetical protein [Planctomycetota bacterium]
MSRLSVALRARLRPTWYRLKRAGYRMQLRAERRRRASRTYQPQATDGPLDPPARTATTAAAASSMQDGVKRRIVVDPPQLLRRDRPPRTIETELHPHFQFDLEHEVPEMAVCELPHGRVWGETGAIVTAENVLLEDLSIAWQQDDKSRGQHPIFANWRYHPVHPLPGRAAALTTDGAQLYYHWLFQLLPRLDLLERAGIALDSVDHFIVNRATQPFELDTLARLGIPREKLVETRVHPQVSAELLLAPSIPLHGSQFSQPLVDFVRGRLAGLPRAQECQPGARRLYLTRAGAGYRHVVNEAEVRERVLARGFEAIALEELRFEEQVQVMSEAGVVLGPHGGGMSNTVFCAAGTRVAEIFSQEYVAPWFWFLANITGVDYHYMIDAAAPRPELAERWNLGASMQVDLSKLDRLLDQLDTA